MEFVKNFIQKIRCFFGEHEVQPLTNGQYICVHCKKELKC